LDQEEQAAIDSLERHLGYETEYEEAKAKIQEAYRLKRLKAEEEENQSKKLMAEDYVTIASEIYAGLDAIFQQSYDNKMIRIDNEYQAQKLAIENSALSEEAKAAKLEALDIKFDQKRKELQKKQAKTDKAMAIFGAIINVAQGITSALTLVPPMSFIMAAIVGALGAIQVAAIASQPIPMAKGGIAKQPVLMGEAGPEIFAPLSEFPRLAQQYFNSVSSTTNNNYGPRKQTLQINVQIGTETIRKHIVDSVNWGFKNKMIKVPVGAVG